MHGNLAALLAGATLGAATTLRSNGLLSGAVLLHDFALELAGLLGYRHLQHDGGGPRPWGGRLMRVLVLGIAGLLVAAGLVFPQIVAWREYCGDPDSAAAAAAEWCATRPLPSIYLYVQARYWNVGFLRYWTAGNVPLFFLAAPTIALLLASGVAGARGQLLFDEARTRMFGVAAKDVPTHAADNHRRFRVVRVLALPQVLLAGAALFSYHVQIITRLASGCVVWYWWVAQRVIAETKGAHGGGWEVGRATVRWMVVYGLVQAVLFAGFLPPA